MRLFRKEVWSYAVLLIILFCIAAIAVVHILRSLENLPGLEYSVVALQIWSLTMGFMFIAGAFGLWAIQFSAEAETRRTISSLVNTMDYLQDGLVVVDRKKRVTGANPAAGSILMRTLSVGMRVDSLFTELPESDIDVLLTPETPQELEIDIGSGEKLRSLRLRSQTADSMILIIISDITQINAQRRMQRQRARLQLIGQLAKGFAHDFTNLLCIMSGKAGVIERLAPDSNDHHEAVRSIIRSAEHGISMAAQLQRLTDGLDLATDKTDISAHVNSAIENLKASLPESWEVKVDTDILDCPPSSLSGIQIEQVVTNLGLLAAESAPAAKTLHLAIGKPSEHPVFDVGGNISFVIAIRSGITDIAAMAEIVSKTDSIGAIESVIRSLIEESGGKLEAFHAPDGAVFYRIAVPASDSGPVKADSTASVVASGRLPGAIESLISKWVVVVAGASDANDRVRKRMHEMKINFIQINDLSGLLEQADDRSKKTDGMIIHSSLLMPEKHSIINAISKLFPDTGIVLLDPPGGDRQTNLPAKTVCMTADSSPDEILNAMLKARSMG